MFGVWFWLWIMTKCSHYGDKINDLQTGVKKMLVSIYRLQNRIFKWRPWWRSLFEKQLTRKKYAACWQSKFIWITTTGTEHEINQFIIQAVDSCPCTINFAIYLYMDDILQTLDDVIKYTKNILCYKLFISILYGNTLNWAKRKQSNIAFTSPEVEYISLTETWQEMQWIQ